MQRTTCYTLWHNLDHVTDIYCFLVMLVHFAVCNVGSTELCLVLLNVSVCSVHRAGSEVSCIGAAAQGTAGHRRQQAVSCCLVPSYEEGYLQARCLLQGKPPACMHCLSMHPCILIDFVHIEKGHLPARCLLQGKPPACMHCRPMHPCLLIDLSMLKKATYKPDAFFKVNPQPACIAFNAPMHSH